MADVDSYADYLLEFLYKLLNKYFPIKTKFYTTKRLKAPWLSADVIRCIDKKQDWYKKMKLGRITKGSYSSYCAALRTVLDTAEKEYYNKKFDSLGNNSKKKLGRSE